MPKKQTEKTEKKYFWDEKHAKAFIGELNWLIVTNPKKIISMIASKGSGKTWPVLAYIIHLFEKDPRANGYLLRKFKHNASKNLTRSFIKVMKDIEKAGYTLQQKYETQQNEITRGSKKRDKHNAQILVLSSFENLDSISGDAPANGGRFAVTMIDEILVPGDIHKVQPEYNEWKGQLDTIVDSLDRFEDEHEDKMKLYMTCNPWIKDHPEIKLLLEHIPEDKWEQFVFGCALDDLLFNEKGVNKLFDNEEFINRLKTNHTLTATSEEHDRLFVRRTKFSNPTSHWAKNTPRILNDIKYALIRGDKETLMKNIGIIHKPEISNDMLVFDINLPYQHDEDWFKTNGWTPIHVSIAWDIDRSRIFTMTPLVLYEKHDQHKFLLGQQVEVVPLIDPDGTRHTLNGDIMEQAMFDYYNELLKHSLIINNQFPDIEVIVDDNSKAYVAVLATKESTLPIINVEAAEKHGEHSIANRQLITQQAYNKGLVVIHPENIRLIDDMNKCIKKDINKPERQDKGRINYLDRIDSAEYSFQTFYGFIQMKLAE